MSNDPNNLYNFKKPNLHPIKDLSSSTNLAFSSTLSSLLASSTPSNNTPSRGRPRPSKTKDDIFKSNRGTKKRALKDLEDDDSTHSTSQIHSTTTSSIDERALHRSKRRLEAKAKLYKRLKKGEGRVGDENDEHEALVDFDRKWVEKDGEKHVESSDDEDEEDPSASQIIDYEDEFGRMRQGTLAQKQRMDRQKTSQLRSIAELSELSARPSMPQTLIHGDTIQHLAFTSQISAEKEAAMEALAKKRDRSATPPEERHYDANEEVRRRGTGFYAFSRDGKVREEEMRNLKGMREETEGARREKLLEKERRVQEVKERRRVLGERRARLQAERFLEGLGGELGGTGGGLDGSELETGTVSAVEHERAETKEEDVVAETELPEIKSIQKEGG